jgi:hypothetical protein
MFRPAGCQHVKPPAGHKHRHPPLPAAPPRAASVGHARWTDQGDASQTAARNGLQVIGGGVPVHGQTRSRYRVARDQRARSLVPPSAWFPRAALASASTDVSAGPRDGVVDDPVHADIETGAHTIPLSALSRNPGLLSGMSCAVSCPTPTASGYYPRDKATGSGDGEQRSEHAWAVVTRSAAVSARVVHRPTAQLRWAGRIVARHGFPIIKCGQPSVPISR